eukprot:CAMPEP_0177764786 /NCGR_PEP_ID=MMETSP0491_2-20121128/7607_1 /TAXON_ID=63592 /ORGANISM="Tetraselmis chuii, Strain PLY429" /LENGTH=58 /DNA_ID=CAMNT_0019281017 /DNA_START=166 /DNA_END=342 /DNA_ORIENTATION=-
MIELVTTAREEPAMKPAATEGSSEIPALGSKTPAASGMPTTLYTYGRSSRCSSLPHSY